jgi:hypothetical protein
VGSNPDRPGRERRFLQRTDVGNTLNAYLMGRYADAHGNEELRRRATRVIDFFVEHGHMPATGMFYDLYSVPRQRMDCWWTGLLLPLAYAEPGGSLEELMGLLAGIAWRVTLERY